MVPTGEQGGAAGGVVGGEEGASVCRGCTGGAGGPADDA